MSAARTALLALVDALAAAVEPVPVTIEDESQHPTTGEPGVRVRVASLTRVGRSRRDGAVLDLELLATVGSTGPRALELTEQMLTALEREPRYAVEAAQQSPIDALGLGILVRVPVAVRLEEPVRWRVTEPMHLDVQVARSVAGVLVDTGGRGVPDALVAAAVGGAGASTDSGGRFRLLVADAERQDLVVEVRGATRTFDADTSTAPVVLRWE